MLIIYFFLSNSGSRKKRSEARQISENRWEVTTEQTNVTLTDLAPTKSYSIDVAAETAAGRGPLPGKSPTPIGEYGLP